MQVQLSSTSDIFSNAKLTFNSIQQLEIKNFFESQEENLT